MAPKTVCIVGVAGFIGSHMLEKIVREKDWIVIGVDMVAPTKIQQLLGAEKKWASRFEFHQVQRRALRRHVQPEHPGPCPEPQAQSSAAASPPPLV